MMGLANWIHWSAWFTKNLLFLLISIIMATILLKVRQRKFFCVVLHNMYMHVICYAVFLKLR